VPGFRPAARRGRVVRIVPACTSPVDKVPARTLSGLLNIAWSSGGAFVGAYRLRVGFSLAPGHRLLCWHYALSLRCPLCVDRGRPPTRLQKGAGARDPARQRRPATRPALAERTAGASGTQMGSSSPRAAPHPHAAARHDQEQSGNIRYQPATLGRGSRRQRTRGDLKEKVEPLHQEAERHDGDGRPYPGREGTFIGRVIAVAIDHRSAPDTYAPPAGRTEIVDKPWRQGPGDRPGPSASHNGSAARLRSALAL